MEEKVIKLSIAIKHPKNNQWDKYVIVGDAAGINSIKNKIELRISGYEQTGLIYDPEYGNTICIPYYVFKKCIITLKIN